MCAVRQYMKQSTAETNSQSDAPLLSTPHIYKIYIYICFEYAFTYLPGDGVDAKVINQFLIGNYYTTRDNALKLLNRFLHITIS